MEVWSIPATAGEMVFDFLLLSLLLVAGMLARRYVRAFRKLLLPGSLLAGFFGLIVGPEFLGIAAFSLDRMGAYVYHLLALTFIGVGLQSARRELSYGVVSLGFMQVAVMALQGVIGLGIALLAAAVFLPDFVPATGLLLPLGFALGPGIAFSIGNSWRAFGFEEAASIGLTISAIGFLFAYVTGVWIVNRALSRRKAAETEPTGPGFGTASEMPPISYETNRGAELIRRNDFVAGPIILLITLTGVVYLATFGLMFCIEDVLRANRLEREVVVAWSFHFIVANLLALGARRLMDALGLGRLLDDTVMHRTTRALADYLIAASIAAISLSVAWTYAGPVALMCLSGAGGTYALLRWTSNRVFKRYRLERFIGMYAQMTGTISSGLALIRVTDPEYRSPVAEDLVLSSGMALALGFPLLLVINLPFTIYSGAIHGYVVVMLLLAAYFLLISFLWYRFFRRAVRLGTADEEGSG